jgi:hypothetical protein
MEVIGVKVKYVDGGIFNVAYDRWFDGDRFNVSEMSLQRYI